MSFSEEMTQFTPELGILYDLDTTARLTGVNRRAILIYYKEGLIEPIIQPPYGTMAFNDDLILAIRRIERLRRIYSADLALIKHILRLSAEVERLRSELRFLRQRVGRPIGE